MYQIVLLNEDNNIIKQGKFMNLKKFLLIDL